MPVRLSLTALLVSLLLAAPIARAEEFPLPQLDLLAWRPPVYACPFAATPPAIDGLPTEAVWAQAAWTGDFVDIEGERRPRPPLRTRAKLLWDQDCLYVAAELEEPQLWATFTTRDAVIYHEHDFELFLDPDGDSHDYYELEINALGTVWDLLLTAPYRDGGHAVDGWDIAGLRSAVHLDGTLNDPRDEDRGWSLELALPWRALEECAPRAGPPAVGETWRLNFSRVEWTLVAGEDGYRKAEDAGGKPLPEQNWVWSPQGLIAMHYPELWGELRFVAAAPAAPLLAGEGMHPLRLVYYAQKRHAAATGRYARSLTALPPLPALPDWSRWPLRMAGDGRQFRAWLPPASPEAASWSIDERGRLLRHPAPAAAPR